MKKLRGHKPGCKCVGCSSETRKRGMKALGLSKKAPRSHSKRRRMVRAAVKKLAALKKFPNPKRRKLLNMKRRVARKVTKAQSALDTFASPRRAARRFKLRRYKVSTSVKAFRKVHKRRHANPSGNLIGTSPTLHMQRVYRFPKARLMTGQNQYQVRIIGIRRHTTLPMSGTVRLIDYRHDAKALRAYGKRAPFRHTFTSPARIAMAGWGQVGTDSGYIVVESSRHIWEKQI